MKSVAILVVASFLLVGCNQTGDARVATVSGNCFTTISTLQARVEVHANQDVRTGFVSVDLHNADGSIRLTSTKRIGSLPAGNTKVFLFSLIPRGNGIFVGLRRTGIPSHPKCTFSVMPS